MQRPLHWVAVLVLMVACPLGTQAQIKPAPAPTDTRPVTLSSPPRQDASAARQGDDELSARPITIGVNPHTPAIEKPATSVRVYARDGRLLNGMKPAGNNRVLDTRTGRYHDTVPVADGQRITR